MNLLEYQAKALFAEVGIPVLPSQQIGSPKELKGLRIPYPIVLKSQVRASGRGRAGGVRFAANTIDAVAAAQVIFKLPIAGEHPEVLLAEAKYDVERELYLAVVLDYNARRPVLLGSAKGGMAAELSPDWVQQVVVEETFSPYYARRLALAMGLSGPLVRTVSDTLERMYRLFVEKDLDLVEINPLGVAANGDLMALDGKVTANDSALNRHPDLLHLLAHLEVNGDTEGGDGPIAMTVPERSWLRRVDPDGQLMILCNGMGLTLATLDLVRRQRGTVAGFVNLRWASGGDFMADLYGQLKRGLSVALDSQPEAILVNLMGSGISVSRTLETIAAALRHRGHWVGPRKSTPRSGESLRDPMPTATKSQVRARRQVTAKATAVLTAGMGMDGATGLAAGAEEAGVLGAFQGAIAPRFILRVPRLEDEAAALAAEMEAVGAIAVADLEEAVKLAVRAAVVAH